MRGAVEITAGETTHLTLGGLNPHAITVTGTVYKAGVPSPNERVWASQDGKDSFASSSTVVADEHGRFELVYPGPGPAKILVAPDKSQIVPIPILLGEEPNQDIDVHIPSGSISGQVIAAAEPSRKTHSVVCRIQGRSPITSIYLTRTAKCDKDGHFEFVHLPAGTYRLSISGIMDPRAVAEDVTLEQNGRTEGVLLETGKVGSATVRVLDASGKPAEGAVVYAQDSRGNLYMLGLNGRTGVDGTKRFGRLGLGEFRFFAQKDGLVSGFSRPLDLAMEEEAERTLRLAPGAYTSIRILDKGQPVSARLWIKDAKGNDFARTLEAFDHSQYLMEGDHTARYELGPVPPGRYRVTARLLDGRTVQGDVLIKLGGDHQLSLSL